MIPQLGLFDFILCFLYLFIVYFFAILYKNNKVKTSSEYNYFIPGLTAKIIGGIMFSLIYVYYYKGGDTLIYFRGASRLHDLLLENPIDYFRILFTSYDGFSYDLSYLKDEISYARAEEEWIMVKFISIVNIFSFNSYFITTLMLSLFSFFGNWYLYKVFIAHFPTMKKQLAIAVFFIPSVVFWGSGILKDTVTLSIIGIYFWNFHRIFFEKKPRFINWIIFVACAFLLFKIKTYILICLTPSMFLGWFIHYRRSIRDPFLRIVITPFLLILFFVGGGYGLTQIANQSNKYKADEIESRIKGFHSWHTQQGGSSYSLGDFEYTPIGVIKKIPASLNVTFFRPYLTESSNPVVLMGALESTFVLVLFLLIMVKLRFKWIRESFKKPLLTTALVFMLVFGFVVGFTSYNFGALARYKIPLMPFFALFLFYFYNQSFNKTR